MATLLTKPIKREVVIDDKPYTVTIDTNGITITQKRFRNGAEITWRELLMRHPEPK